MNFIDFSPNLISYNDRPIWQHEKGKELADQNLDAHDANKKLNGKHFGSRSLKSI